jgi:hypothetical protein
MSAPSIDFDLFRERLDTIADELEELEALRREAHTGPKEWSAWRELSPQARRVTWAIDRRVRECEEEIERVWRGGAPRKEAS